MPRAAGKWRDGVRKLGQAHRTRIVYENNVAVEVSAYGSTEDQPYVLTGTAKAGTATPKERERMAQFAKILDGPKTNLCEGSIVEWVRAGDQMHLNRREIHLELGYPSLQITEY